MAALRSQPLLLVNPRSGEGPDAGELAAAARERGIDPHVLAPGEDAARVARASRADVLGMAGGDGSLAAVAAVAVERGAGFVCVPFGTRNHFARDAGLDGHDPVAALDAFAGVAERRVDVARVNGRVFLNNLSLGAYARLVHRREHHRRRGEALARARSLVQAARRPRRLRARVDGADVSVRVLLVGNNRYELDLFTVGERRRLDEGVLCLWTAAGVLPTAWDERIGERFRIELPGGRVQAAADGEPLELESPLEVECARGALRLLVPGTPFELPR